MLELIIPGTELFDDETSTFIPTKETILQLEHSLVSLSKWESRWCKPFLGKDPKSTEEMIDYVKCMTITHNVNPLVYNNLSDEAFTKIDAYLNAKMTATTITNHQPQKPSSEIITSELIYYWMIAQNIPLECQKWYLNRLLILIQICSIKNQPPKKQGRQEMLKNRSALNAARRAQYQTKG